MNIVREYINEKFAEESDPIEDLNIGIKQLIIDAVKEAFYINNVIDRISFRIDEITIYSLGIEIHSNYPKWGAIDIKKYFNELFKTSGLSVYLKKEIDPHYYTYDVFFMINFKEKYELLFNKDIVIDINNYK